MTEEQTAKKRPGRRPKVAGDLKSSSLTFRTRAGMREQLEASAKARDLSISEEVERRILLSLDLASNPSNEYIVRTLADALRLSEIVTGRSWTTDKTTATMACAAMQAAAAIIVAHHGDSDQDKDFTELAEKVGVIQAVRAAALYSGMPIEKLLEIGKDDVSAFFGKQAMREVVSPNLLAQLLRGDAPAKVAPEPAGRPATPDKLAGMAPPTQNPGEPSTATAPKRSRAKTEA